MGNKKYYLLGSFYMVDTSLKNKFYLLMAALSLHCCAWAFASCGEWGPLFAASPLSGFSCCRARALECVGSVVVARGFLRPAACEIFLCSPQ